MSVNKGVLVNSNPPLRYLHTQMRPSGESSRIMWPSCGLKLASPELKHGGAVNTNACAQKIVQLRNISTQSTRTNTKGSSQEHYIETTLGKTLQRGMSVYLGGVGIC